MTRLGVLGWPVAHSRSPAMHTAALRELGLAPPWTYQRLPVAPELFAETTRALGGAGFHGANVTIPHKPAALALADEASEAARAIGAANTLTFAPDGTIAAENTDAPGLVGGDGARRAPARGPDRDGARRRRHRARGGVGAAERRERGRCRCGTARRVARRRSRAPSGFGQCGCPKVPTS